MKLHENSQAQMNLISRYGGGELVINGQKITAPCMVAPGFLHTDWISELAALSMESLGPAWLQQPRILLLGATGSAAGAARTLRAPLAVRQIALESMELGAACRTYNVLAQEDRQVVALLFP